MKSNKFIALALTAVLGASTVLSYVPSGAALYSYAAMGSAASGRNVATATDMAGAGAASGASSASGNAAAAGASPRAASASAAATATPTDLPLNNAVATATDMSSNDALANTKVTSKGVPGLSSLFTYRTDEEIEAEVAALTKYQRYESYTALVVVKDVELGELEAGSTVTLTVNDDAGSAFAATLTTEELLEAMGVDPDDTARIAKIRTAEELIKLSGEVLFTDDTDRVSIISVTNKAYSVKSLLKVLLSDPRVVSADPDYTVKVETTANDPAPTTPAPTTPTPTTPAPTTSAQTTPKTGEDGKQYIIADYYSDVTSSQYAYSTSAANMFSIYYRHKYTPNPFTKDEIRVGNNVHLQNWGDSTAVNSEGVIAVIDSGIDFTHPEFKNVMYSFSDELQQKLGCTEYGYVSDSSATTNVPMDNTGHGTHVAGIIAANWDGNGISGAANGAQLMAVKSLNKVSTDADGIKAFKFVLDAVNAGVPVRLINYSIGGPTTSRAFVPIIKALGEAGVLTVKSSGNESQNVDKNGVDTGVFSESPYVITVDSSGAALNASDYTNYGIKTDIFAPGESILSSVPTNKMPDMVYYPMADPNAYMADTFDFTEFGVSTVNYGKEYGTNYTGVKAFSDVYCY